MLFSSIHFSVDPFDLMSLSWGVMNGYSYLYVKIDDNIIKPRRKSVCWVFYFPSHVGFQFALVDVKLLSAQVPFSPLLGQKL